MFLPILYSPSLPSFLPSAQNGGRLPRPDHPADAAAVVEAAKVIAGATAGCEALNEAVIAELARGSSASIGM